jgi:hypothetical protein
VEIVGVFVLESLALDLSLESSHCLRQDLLPSTLEYLKSPALNLLLLNLKLLKYLALYLFT